MTCRGAELLGPGGVMGGKLVFSSRECVRSLGRSVHRRGVSRGLIRSVVSGMVERQSE